MNTTITDWLDAGANAGVLNDNTVPDPEVPERARGPGRYPAKYRAKILDGYKDLSKSDKEAVLRREGLYSSLISEWRRQRYRGAIAALAKPAGRPEVDPRDPRGGPVAWSGGAARG